MNPRLLCLLAAASLLCGCSVRPDGSNGIRRDFSVPDTTLESAYHRALDFARTCHTGGGLFKHATITNEMFPAEGDAYVHVAWGGGTMPEQINLHRTAHGVIVSVVASGHGMWDERELDAAYRSTSTGSAVCR